MAQIGMGLGEIGLQMQSLAVMSYGRLEQTLELEGDAKVGMGRGIVGLHCYGLTIMGNGLVKPAAVHQNKPQVEVGCRKFRIDLQGLSKVRRLADRNLDRHGDRGKCLGFPVCLSGFHGDCRADP